MRNSIRFRLTLTLIALAIGPLILVGWFLSQQSFDVEREQALTLQREIATRIAAQVSGFLRDRESEINVLGGELRSIEPNDRGRQISRLLEVPDWVYRTLHGSWWRLKET